MQMRERQLVINLRHYKRSSYHSRDSFRLFDLHIVAAWFAHSIPCYLKYISSPWAARACYCMSHVHECGRWESTLWNPKCLRSGWCMLFKDKSCEVKDKAQFIYHSYIYTFLTCVNRKRWLPSLGEGVGNGLGMSHTDNRTTLPQLPFNAHQTVNKKEADPGTPGVGQWREIWRPCITFVAALCASRHKGQ